MAGLGSEPSAKLHGILQRAAVTLQDLIDSVAG
jgi:hypothetical protein